jgi:hypothetical protein
MNKIENFDVVMILTVALVISIVNVSTAHSIELTVQDESFAFMSDVLMLDVESYNVTLVSNVVSFPSDLGGLPMENPRYTLESKESKLRVLLTFRNKTLSWCKLSALEGSPLYTQTPSTNLLERADAFLENYQNYLGNSEFHQYREILSTISEVKGTSVTVGNVRFEMEGTSFCWVDTFNGADYTKISFTFWNDGEFAFFDDRYKRIGSTTVNITKEQAIGIAMEWVQNMSWTYDGAKVGNVTVLEDRTSVALLTRSREPLVLYPYWQVSLTFDKIYPGNVYGVTYDLWADTGEVFYGFMHLFGSSVPPEEPEEPTDSNIIPEFPSWIIPSLFLTATLAVIPYRIRLRKKFTN